MKKRISIILFVLLSSLAITHSIGIGGEQDINAYHHGDTLWYDSMTIEDYLEIPKTLDDECTTKFVLGTDKATLDAELAPYYGGGFCVNGGSFVNKTLGVGFGSVAKGALAFGGFSLSEGAGGWPAYSWAFVGKDEGVPLNVDSCTYKSGGTCVDAFPAAQIRGGIALKDCELDAYGAACENNDAVICTGADSCYVAQGKIFFDNSDSSFIFVPNTITASTGLLTIKGNISSDADLTRRLGEPANRYTEIHTNDTYTTRIYGVEGDTARYWGVSTLDLGIFGTYPTLEPYSDGPLGNIGAVHNGMVVYTNPLTGDTIDPGLTMIKIGAGSANMVFDSSDNTFRFDAPIKLPNGFSEHFVHSDYKTSFYQNNNIFQIDANDTTMYTAFNMNVSAPEFIASIDMYTPTIIGTKTGDTTHLAIDSDVIIDNQQADIPTTLQIKSDRDSGLTLQDDITNQSIVTYGGNLILAPDAGHLEVIPAVNDTNFGTDEHPWNEGHFNYIYGDVSNVTGMPSSDFNDTGLLYQNGTRNLTADWNAGDVNISITPGAGVTQYPGKFFAVDGMYSGLLLANDTNRTNGATLTMNTAPSNSAVYPELNPINKDDKTIFVIKSSQDSNRTGQGYPAIMLVGAYDGSDYGFMTQDSNKTLRLFSNNGNMSLQAYGDSPNGNVGIGTKTPNYKLDVNGTVNANYFKGDGSNLTGLPSFSDTGLFYQNGTRNMTGNMYFNNSAASINHIGGGASFTLSTTSNTLALDSADVITPKRAVGAFRSGTALFIGVYNPTGAAIFDMQMPSTTRAILEATSSAPITPSIANTTDWGTSTYYWRNGYFNQLYGKNDTILSFDDYEDTELVRDIAPQTGNEKYFQMPSILFDKINETRTTTKLNETKYNETKDKITENLSDNDKLYYEENETIETESLNMGKVIGLAYGTLKELIVRDDELTSEIDWLSIENQRLKEQITNICKENELKGCT